MKDKKQSKDSIDKIKKDLENTKKQSEEYYNSILRLKAEFENYQKRIEKENIKTKKFAKEDLILKLLDLKDNFERSLQHSNNDEFSNGIRLIEKQFNKILEEESITKLESLNKPFNPEEHEAVAFEKGKNNIITEEINPGYKLHDKIIRPTKVKIGQEKLK